MVAELCWVLHVRNWHRYRPVVQIWGRMSLANRKREGSGMAASATSVLKPNEWLLPPSATFIQVPAGSPDLADRGGVCLAVVSEVLTTQATAGYSVERLQSMGPINLNH